MVRRILLISEDEKFIRFLEISALTLTKLNHHIDIIRVYEENINLAIIDFDSPGSIKYLNFLRGLNNFSKKKVLGVYTTDEEIKKDEIFKAGCDSLMSKSEFEKAGNNVLIF